MDTKTDPEIVRSRSRSLMGAFLAFGAALIALGLGPQAASAATSPTMQWMTGTSGDINGAGQSLTAQFGSFGVTATVTGLTNTNDGIGLTQGGGGWPEGASFGADPGFDAYLETDPPNPWAGISHFRCCTPNAATGSQSFTFNKPVIAPVLHFFNVDGAFATVNGTTTDGDPITFTELAKNNAMEWGGNTFNTTTQLPTTLVACEDNNDPQNTGNGACGSFRMNGPGETIQSFNISDVGQWANGDGWVYSVSFPWAPLTKQFDPSPIFVGETSTLTFTIANPNNPGQVDLAPLDFTDVLPDNVTLADGAVSNNGNCGSPTVNDSGGGALGEGDNGIEATGISVAVGATCTITINVTSDTPGSYVNDNDNLSTEIANLVPNADTTLVVLPLTDLEVVKDAPGKVDRTGRITWEMEVTNHGPSPSSGSTLTDEIPNGVTDATSPTPGCQVAGGILECAIGALDVGESTTVLLRGRAPFKARTCFRNAATIDGDETDPVPENNQDRVRTCTLKPEVKITKKAGKDVVHPGETISYKIQVRNVGKGSAFNQRVCDSPKDHLKIISAPGADSVGPGKACWNINRLRPGSTKTFRVVSQVAMDAPASDCGSGGGGASNVATVKGDNARDKDDECVPIVPPPGCLTGKADATDGGERGAERPARKC